LARDRRDVLLLRHLPVHLILLRPSFARGTTARPPVERSGAPPPHVQILPPLLRKALEAAPFA
jgi:hypothetical protein